MFWLFCLFMQGKVALVTGGDSGIGRAVAHCFVLEGATVAFTYVKSQEDKDAQDTLNMLRKDKTPDAKDPISIPADLGYDNNCKNVVDEVVNAFGHIDILINNCAEQYKSSSIEQIDEERLERVFRTNIFSYFFMIRYMISINIIIRLYKYNLIEECVDVDVVAQACPEAHERRKFDHKHNISECVQGPSDSDRVHIDERSYSGPDEGACTAACPKRHKSERCSSWTNLDAIDPGFLR